MQLALMDPKTNPKLGYNLDAWDGYIVARETLLGAAAQLGKKLISLAGDSKGFSKVSSMICDGWIRRGEAT